MNPNWIDDQYGGTSTLNLGNDFIVVVDYNHRGYVKDVPAKFGFYVGRYQSERVDYETSDLAKEAAERAAKKILTEAIQKLG